MSISVIDQNPEPQRCGRLGRVSPDTEWLNCTLPAGHVYQPHQHDSKILTEMFRDLRPRPGDPKPQ